MISWVASMHTWGNSFHPSLAIIATAWMMKLTEFLFMKKGKFSLEKPGLWVNNMWRWAYKGKHCISHCTLQAFLEARLLEAIIQATTTMIVILTLWVLSLCSVWWSSCLHTPLHRARHLHHWYPREPGEGEHISQCACGHDWQWK